MALNIRKAVRENVWVKLALMAPSGGGKTYSALRLATGMKGELEAMGKPSKILMVNTEASRGIIYADEFEYDILDVMSPHNPEKYVDILSDVEEDGTYGIVIMDSTSHEWIGKGGCIELHEAAGGNYQAWGKVTPRHNKFIEKIADSEIHIIATMRGKDQYEMEKSDSGRVTVKKLGVGSRQREGFEYEFTATFLIDQASHMSTVQKDNTHKFENEGAVLLSEKHGTALIRWANSGDGYTPTVRHSTPIADQMKTLKKEVIGFGYEYDLLEDKIYYNSKEKPYQFRDVTEILLTNYIWES